eukprot:Selendium_serpulae@DN7381_c0_g1_i1.p1
MVLIFGGNVCDEFALRRVLDSDLPVHQDIDGIKPAMEPMQDMAKVPSSEEIIAAIKQLVSLRRRRYASRISQQTLYAILKHCRVPNELVELIKELPPHRHSSTPNSTSNSTFEGQTGTDRNTA